MSPFWAPNAVQYDLAFYNHEFKDFLSTFNILTRPIPARQDNKNVMESKQKITRDVILKNERK